MNDLKPCPFCGCNEQHMKSTYNDDPMDSGFFIWCGYCDTYGPCCGSKEQAILEWNTRPIEEKLEADDETAD